MIKVCGITRREDADAAVRHGATAVGFVFWPRSPRYVAPEVAADIVRGLPPDVMAVGVFVDEPLETIRDVASTVGLRGIQLHGDEPPAFASALDGQVLKAMKVGQAAEAEAWPAETLILLDAIDPVLRGGTGTPVDWAAAAAVARRRPVVLAGGLTSENVGDAVETVRPFGVDVSSGVERAPGIKDHDEIRRFVHSARAAFGVVRGAGRQRGAGGQR
jgi:phosphoribosylanthranilate isomerase